MVKEQEEFFRERQDEEMEREKVNRFDLIEEIEKEIEFLNFGELNDLLDDLRGNNDKSK